MLCGAFKYIYVLCFGVDLLRSFELLDFKNNMLFYTFSAASLMATASISSTTRKEEVEKERRKTQQLQNKLQEASAMQAEKRNLSAPFLQTLQVWLSNIWQGTSLCFSAGLVSCSRFLSRSCSTQSAFSIVCSVVFFKRTGMELHVPQRNLVSKLLLWQFVFFNRWFCNLLFDDDGDDDPRRSPSQNFAWLGDRVWEKFPTSLRCITL